MATVTDLTNKRIADSYVQLLHTGEDGGLTSTPLQIYDGDGTGSALKLATTSINLADSHVLKLGTGNDLTLYHDGSNSYITSTSGLRIATETSGVAITIGHTTSETTVADNLSVSGNLAVTGNATISGNLTFGDANTDTVSFGADIDSNVIPDDDDTYDLGSSSKQWQDIYIDGTAYLDAIDFNGTAISSTAAELNIVDGDTSASSTTLADADRLVVNDAGTMKQVALTDFETYFESALDTLSNVTTVGTLNSGAISSGFGAIDIGSNSLSTTGSVTLGATTFGDNDITNVGSIQLDSIAGDGDTNTSIEFSGSDVITVSTGGETQVTFNDGSILPTTDNDVDLGSSSYEFKDGYFDGTLYADAINLNGTAINSTASELNLLDGSAKSTSSITIADADAFIVIDGTTTKQIPASDLETYMESSLDTLSNVTTVGTLNSGAISSGFGAIDIGSSALSTTGSVTLGATSFGDNSITNVNDIALDSISADGTDINIAVDDNSATALTIKQGSDAYLIVDTANSSESVSIGTGISGTAITLGHSTSETTVADNLTVTGNATVSGNLLVVGDSSEVKADNLVVDNPTIAMGLTNGSAPSADSGFDLGLKPHWHTGSTAKTAFLGVDVSTSASAPKLTYIPDASFSSDVVSGTAGTIVADLEGDVTGDLTGTADVATSFTASANNSTDETVYPVFVDGATGTQGAETDTGLTYNPSSGMLTISGELDAGSLDISGNADIDGTLEADAYTVDGTALNEYIADTVGAMVGSNTESGITVAYQDADNTLDFTVGTINQDTTGTAAIATTVTITDNESTDEDNAIVFTSSGDVDGGNLGLESDGNLIYNPSTGRLTATQLAGTLQTASQTNITSVGTIGTGTWEATDVAVAHGGTGASSLTANGVLIGNGTSAVTAVDLSTKGKILIGDGSGNPQALAVGSNDYVLTADSGETTGVKWSAIASAAIASTANGADNRIATYSSSTALNGEANLTFDGSALTVAGTVTVGSDGSGQDVTFYSGTSGEHFVWDAREEKLTITGTNGQTALDVADGNLVVADNIDVEGDIDVNGTANLDNTDIDGTLTQDGGAVVFNESGADYDFRIESDDDANAFVVDGGDDRVGIGILAPAVKCHIYFTGATTEALRVENAQGINSHAIQTRSGHSDPTNADGGRILQACSVNGTQVGLISWANQATSYGTSSDYRLKENNVTLANGLEKLNRLKPYTFNWIGSSDVSVDGFFAHEVAEIVPQSVQGLKDAVNDDGSVSPQSMDSSHLVPLLVKAVQELSAKNDELSAKVEALENK